MSIIFRKNPSFFVKFLSNYSKMAAKSALIILAEGAEEMETVIPADVLRRGGVNVTVAGLTPNDVVQCSRQVYVKPDSNLTDALKKAPFDVVILPGGLKGAKNLAESPVVGSVLKDQETAGRLIAAICAAPLALKSHKVGQNKSITSHPSVKDELLKDSTFKYSEQRVVQDGKLITSRAPGTAFEFALKILENLHGKSKVDEILPPLLLHLP